MSSAQLYIDGEDWEIMGDVEDSFLGYENELEASRNNKIYAKTTPKVKKVSVSKIGVNAGEIEKFEAFFESCEASTEGFTTTIAMGADCGKGAIDYIYTGCLIMGEPIQSVFNNSIEGFEFGYEKRTVKK